jgi:hypothetical protein
VFVGAAARVSDRARAHAPTYGGGTPQTRLHTYYVNSLIFWDGIFTGLVLTPNVHFGRFLTVPQRYKEKVMNAGGILKCEARCVFEVGKFPTWRR